MATLYKSGVTCWVADKTEGWLEAKVTSASTTDGETTLELVVQDESTRTVKFKEADVAAGKSMAPPLRNPPEMDTAPDLTTLSYLNEPSVLYAIRTRYERDMSIYTFSGIVLIAVNPFARMDEEYDDHMVEIYSRREREALQPHLFSIAGNAYTHMKDFQKNQTIVVSGESGAGKTMSAKYIMRYFALAEEASSSQKKLTNVEDEILATNPIMEAFGNAKTIRNDNSSRFGKYMEIQFSETMQIIGAKIRTYLLERSRIVSHASTERGYHIFYQLLRGITDDERKEFSLGTITDYAYLQGDPDVDDVDDAADFAETRKSLGLVGVDKTQQHALFQILAALLHLGNVEIKGLRSSVHVSSEDPALVVASKLLGVNPAELARWFTKKQIKMRSETITSDLDPKTAVVVRDSVSKYIYSALFDWLVSTINTKLGAPTDKVASFIGVLDIYGFEHFKTNSFEQFCINYANEKLQQEFNQHVFKLEQDEYQKEELDWTYIDFVDNQPCISVIESKLGVLGLLDEESRMPSGSDDGFTQKLYSTLDNAKHQPYFKKGKFGNTSFIIGHYAMDVSYETEGFIEKNRDTVPDMLVDVLAATTNPFLKGVFDSAAAAAAAAEEESAAAASAAAAARPGPARGGPAKARKPTLGSIFKTSLIELMKTINETNVHYIRCIKPNESKEAWKFDGPMVLSQLRACGVLETIRISAAGFPSRSFYEEFANRYELLLHSQQRNAPGNNAQVACKAILAAAHVDEDKYQLGKTKIFLRVGVLAMLERLRNERHSAAAIAIQKQLRMYLARRSFTAAIASILAVQTQSRGFIVRKRARDAAEAKAARRLQAQARGNVDRRKFAGTRASIVSIQTASRAYIARTTMVANRQAEAATLLQTAIRGRQARDKYSHDYKRITLVQSMVRRRGARRELQKLREERSSVKHHEEQQYRLENKVIELQNSLSSRGDELRAAQDALAAAQTQIGTLNTQVGEHTRSLTDSKEEHTRALAEHEERYGASTQALEAAEQKLRVTTESFEQQVAALSAENTAAKDRIAELENELQTSHKQIDELKQGALAASTIGAAAAAHGAQTRSLQMQGHAQGNVPNGSVDPNTIRGTSEYANGEYAPAYAETALQDLTNPQTGALDAEIEEMLSAPDGAKEELIVKLIQNLVVPTPKTNEVLPKRDVLYPANMVNMVISEMWRFGFLAESEQFIGKALESIQGTVKNYKGEKIIPVGAFWLSNVQEIYSFLCLAETNIHQNQQLRLDINEVEMQQYERLTSLAKHDAESVIYNIYYIWMKELKKMCEKMIVPAVVEEQSIPGFQVEDNSRFLSRYFTTTSDVTMNDLLTLLTRVYTAMKAFYVDAAYIKQPMHELLEMTGARAFNDMIMRKNFLSWKRAVQINYNVARIEEWCKGHDVPEGALSLERLMQSAKLLQLKKSFDQDVDILYDICWSLTPLQIQRLITNYQVADYEPPIPAKVKDLVAQRVKQSKDASTTLLLDVSPANVVNGFIMSAPRVLQRIDPYLPASLDVPQLRKLIEFTAQATRLESIVDEEGLLLENGQILPDEAQAHHDENNASFDAETAAQPAAPHPQPVES